MVVVLAPVLDRDLCLGEAREQLGAEQLVGYPRAEGLDVGVLPGCVRLDVGAAGVLEAAPVPEPSALNSGPLSQRMCSGELGGVLVGDPVSATTSATNRSRAAWVASVSIRRRHLIVSASRVNSSTTCRSFKIFPSAGLVELVVRHPHVIRPRRTEAVRWGGRVAQAPTLMSLLRHAHATNAAPATG